VWERKYRGPVTIDMVSLLARGSILSADQPLQCGDPALIRLDRRGGDRLVLEGTHFRLLNPDVDQVAEETMPLGEAVQRLAGYVILRYLALDSVL
jgi:glutamate racemase